MVNTPEYVNYDDYEKVCRTCGEYGQLLSLYERNNDNLTYADMVMECSSIQIKHNDGFPEKICLICEALVKQCYAFKQQCKQLDNFFHNERKSVEVQTSKVVESKVEDELLIEESEKNAALDTPEDMDRIIEIPSPLEIVIVKEELQYPDSVVKPQKNCLLPERVICSTCGKSIKSSYMKRHMLSHAKEKPCMCKVCGKRFIFPIYLKHHMVVHSDDTPHLCSTCGKAFKRIDSLNEHLMIHTGETPHLCKYCGKGFRALRHMKTHRNIHTKEKSCKCNICGNQYAQPGNLKLHKIRVHHDVTEEPSQAQGKLGSKFPSTRVKQENCSFKCDTCGKQLKTRHSLRRHVLVVHRGVKQFSCINCGKEFSTKVGLDLHSHKHTGGKENECKICYKTFAHKNWLVEHMRIHTGEKPYKCNICDRRFVQLSHMKRHSSLIHGTGIKRHQCDICEKYFSLAANLKQHKRIHTGETRFICSVCNKGFYDSSSLKKHKRTHSKKTIPNKK